MLATGFAFFDPDRRIESIVARVGIAVLTGVAWGVRFALAGGVIGTVFSSAIRLSYQGRRLADINPTRFAWLGGVVGGVGVPLYLQAMNVISGDGPIAWGLVGDDAIWASVFGAAAATASILLARRADAAKGEADADVLEDDDDRRSCRRRACGTPLPRHERVTRWSVETRRVEAPYFIL